MQKNFSVLLMASALLALTGSAMAHMGAKGIVKERMEVMQAVGKAMKSVSGMARGKTPFDGQKVVKTAGEIAAHGQRIISLFPEGSGQGVSEASPKIWQDPDGFKESAGRMVRAAQVLGAAARTDDTAVVKAAFRALSKTCGGCHKKFRIKKKKN